MILTCCAEEIAYAASGADHGDGLFHVAVSFVGPFVAVWDQTRGAILHGERVEGFCDERGGIVNNVVFKGKGNGGM
jgi:hypothetical protein